MRNIISYLLIKIIITKWQCHHTLKCYKWQLTLSSLSRIFIMQFFFLIFYFDNILLYRGYVQCSWRLLLFLYEKYITSTMKMTFILTVQLLKHYEKKILKYNAHIFLYVINFCFLRILLLVGASWLFSNFRIFKNFNLLQPHIKPWK